MKFSRQTYQKLSSIFCAAILVLFALPVMADDTDHSMERLNQTMQIWRLEQAAVLQRALEMEITHDYEAQVAQQASRTKEQAALVNSIDAVEPVDLTNPTEALAIDRTSCIPGKTRC